MKNFRNRDKAKQAGYGKNWCHNCDADLVAEGRRCRSCGRIQAPKKIRYDRGNSCQGIHYTEG